MALLPRGFSKGLLLGAIAAVAWGVLGNRRRRATVAGPLIERTEGLPFVGPRLYKFFAWATMADVYRAVGEDVVSQASAGDLLEIGAGTGFLAVEIGQRSRDLNVTAMNRVPGMVQAAEAHVYHSGLGRQIKVARGDATDVPFADEVFDYVVSLGGPQHWSAPELALAEIHRVLKPGGRAWVYSLRREMPEEGWDRVREGLSPLMRPVFDVAVSGPAQRAMMEGQLEALAGRTPFGQGKAEALDVRFAGVTAPMLTRLTLSK